jgi:hypothetical protein
VLETWRKELEKDLALCSQLQLGLAHRTGPREKAALGTRRRHTAIIHRTVRWVVRGELVALGKRKRRRGYNSPDCSVVHRTVRWANGRQRQWLAAQSTGDAWRFQRSAGDTGLSGVHWTVFGAPMGPELQRSSVPGKEGDRALNSYSDCPVHHPTEGKFGLPSWPPTAPSCLGAIKGTPRRMEESLKYSLNILRLPHSVSAHLIDCVSDLSFVLVVNSLCFISSLSLGLCACVCCRFVCVALPNLTLVLSLWHLL